jgi:hypothetical protein
MLYGGAKGLVMWYYGRGRAGAHQAPSSSLRWRTVSSSPLHQDVALEGKTSFANRGPAPSPIARCSPEPLREGWLPSAVA